MYGKIPSVVQKRDMFLSGIGYLEVSIHGGYPHSWMVYFMDNPTKMEDLGVPLFQEISIYGIVMECC